MPGVKPIRVFYSELSGRFYATRAYREKQDGGKEYIMVTGQKFDVTNDIGYAVKKYNLEFKSVTP